MTKSQDLCLQRRPRSEQSDQRQPNQAANISHQPRASPDSTALTSRIEFPTMTGLDASIKDDDLPIGIIAFVTGIDDRLRIAAINDGIHRDQAKIARITHRFAQLAKALHRVFERLTVLPN